MEATISFTNNTAMVKSCTDRRIEHTLYELMKYDIPGARFTAAFKRINAGSPGMGPANRWDGTSSFYSRVHHQFPSGFLRPAVDALEEKGVTVTLVDKRSRPLIAMPADKDIRHCLKNRELRYYQIDSVKAALREARGIIHSPTGSGKTAMGNALIKFGRDAKLRCLFITCRNSLLRQTAEDLQKSLGVVPGIIGDDEADYSKPITIATIQTLYSHLSPRIDKKTKQPTYSRYYEQVKAFLGTNQMLILDEAHVGSAESYQTVIPLCYRAYFRIGVTATPFMKGDYETLRLISITGPKIIEIPMKELIEKGFLAQPILKFIPIGEPMLPKKTTWQEAYSQGIANNPYRHDIIIREAIDLASKGESVLVLIAQKKHGKALLDILRDRYPHAPSAYIDGDDDTPDRQTAFRDIESGKLKILIASTILDMGVDLPALDSVILAGGWKSKGHFLQRIGRTMRPKVGKPNICHIVDFLDLGHKFIAKHSKARYVAAKKEPGYQIVASF